MPVPVMITSSAHPTATPTPRGNATLAPNSHAPWKSHAATLVSENLLCLAGFRWLQSSHMKLGEEWPPWFDGRVHSGQLEATSGVQLGGGSRCPSSPGVSGECSKNGHLAVGDAKSTGGHARGDPGGTHGHVEPFGSFLKTGSPVDSERGSTSCGHTLPRDNRAIEAPTRSRSSLRCDNAKRNPEPTHPSTLRAAKKRCILDPK
ncbi:g5284 [Coccomyxa elongata]